MKSNNSKNKYNSIGGGSNEYLEVGDFVAKGELIGLVGNTGHIGAPHLHFQAIDGNSIAQAEGLRSEFEQFDDVASSNLGPMLGYRPNGTRQ